MRWDDILAALLPLILKGVGYLLPAVGGLLGGPIGWIASIIIAQLGSWIADQAERLFRFNKISAEVKAQVDEFSKTAQEFFILEDRKKNGEAIAPEEREAAKQRMKDAAKKLIQFKKLPS